MKAAILIFLVAEVSGSTIRIRRPGAVAGSFHGEVDGNTDASPVSKRHVFDARKWINYNSKNLDDFSFPSEDEDVIEYRSKDLEDFVFPKEDEEVFENKPEVHVLNSLGQLDDGPSSQSELSKQIKDLCLDLGSKAQEYGNFLWGLLRETKPFMQDDATRKKSTEQVPEIAIPASDFLIEEVLEGSEESKLTAGEKEIEKSNELADDSLLDDVSKEAKTENPEIRKLWQNMEKLRIKSAKVPKLKEH